MKTTCGKMLPVLAVLAALFVAARAAAAPPKPRGQQIHLFTIIVHIPDSIVDIREYKYSMLAKVLGSVEAARNAIDWDTDLGTFGAFLTNNQARRLSKVPGVVLVKRWEDPTPLPETDGHL